MQPKKTPKEICSIKRRLKYSATLLRNKRKTLLHTPTNKTADCIWFPLVLSVVHIHSACKCLCESTRMRFPWERSSFFNKIPPTPARPRGYWPISQKLENKVSNSYFQYIVQEGPPHHSSLSSPFFPYKSSKTQRCLEVSFCITLSLKLLWGITASWYQMMHTGLSTALSGQHLSEAEPLFIPPYIFYVFLKTNLFSDFHSCPIWCKAASWGWTAVCSRLLSFLITLRNTDQERYQPWLLML